MSFNNFKCGVLKELHFCNFVVILCLQFLHGNFDPVQGVLCELHTLFVIHEPLQIVHVLIELTFSSLATILNVVQLPLALHRFVLVALVKATRGMAVVLPVPQAQPAEFVPASARARVACHVIASLVLLNRPPTLRAILGIRDHPIYIFRLTGVLQLPLSDACARSRAVRLFLALETELVPTAAHNVVGSTSFVFYDHITTWTRAP
mmetsp:Transcript_477/g.734  ORF Transcript_477/g.734 Transcript_477/m.734 type:complete len:206 (-) Transcript_477:970-1587(-)